MVHSFTCKIYTDKTYNKFDDTNVSFVCVFWGYHPQWFAAGHVNPAPSQSDCSLGIIPHHMTQAAVMYGWPGACFTNVSLAFQNILSKFLYCSNSTSHENFKMKLCTCAQSNALGACTNFQLKILTPNMISGIAYFSILFCRAHKTLVKQPPGQQGRHCL